MVMSKIKSVTKDYTGVYKIVLENDLLFYSNKEYSVGHNLKYILFMGCVKVME